MMMRMVNFCRNEDGAVTVDWVVLTAAVCALAGGAVLTLQGDTGSISAQVGSALTAVQVPDTGL